MLIDDYDTLDEKQDVAIITPVDSPEEPEPEPMADDCEILQMEEGFLTSILCGYRRSYEITHSTSTTGSGNRERRGQYMANRKLPESCKKRTRPYISVWRSSMVRVQNLASGNMQGST